MIHPLVRCEKDTVNDLMDTDLPTREGRGSHNELQKQASSGVVRGQ